MTSQPITLPNTESWIDLYTLVDCHNYQQVEDINYLVINFTIPEEYTSTTRTLLRRILREINRKITLVEATYEEGTFKLLGESVHTNITEEEWMAAQSFFEQSKDYEYEEDWCPHVTNRPAHNNSSPSGDGNLSPQSDSEEDEPSPQPVL